MADRINWKAEVEFDGTVEDFNRMAGMLNDLPIVVRIPEWPRPGPFPGIYAMPIEKLLAEKQLREIVSDAQPLQIKYIKDIAGGIRLAHVHLGDQVYLIDRAKFQVLVGEVAQRLATRRVEAIGDYVGVMDAISRVAIIPIQLP